MVVGRGGGRFLCEIKKLWSFLPGSGRVNVHSLQKTDLQKKKQTGLHDFLKGGPSPRHRPRNSTLRHVPSQRAQGDSNKCNIT